ncbi:MAG: metallophosphoesterase [Alphaproteobacteria bacterium]|nr:metallophosphoesterase [Alphaproteobacteria bacterium]
MFFLGLTLITILMAIFIIKFSVLPLNISLKWKMFFSAIILLFSQKTGLVFFLSPFFPQLNSEPAMFILGFFFAFILFMFLCTLFVCILAFFSVFLPLYSVFITAFILSFIGVFMAVKVPSVHQITINAGLVEPFKIVQLTDLHIGSGFSGKWLEKVVQKTNALKPDVVVITGDLIDGSPDVLMNDLLPLKKLKAPVYYVLGNHEYYYGAGRWKKTFESLGLKLLENTSVDLGHFVVGGVGMPNASAFDETPPDLEKTFENSDLSKKRILLSHYPELFDEAIRQHVFLQLSGHTHGGQLFWPFNLMTKKSNKGYLKGLYQKGEHYLYVSHGTGVWGGLPLRLGTCPEITEIILK